ncbi:MAG: substrate-binding domain-containing protein, partial [Acidimicrobiaceae bacterium]|nr:substrate-binding domain-containing protein [Acidimicrobiaceae bacterium]
MRRRGWRLGLPLVAALAALATACGSNNNNSSTNTTAASGGGATTAPAAAGGGGSGSGPTCATGSITGAGSTFVNNIALEWIKNYTAKCHGATINYQSVGSGAGITQFTSGTVNFGATDVPLTAAQTAALQSKGPTVQIPWAAGGIALEYNLSGVNNL